MGRGGHLNLVFENDMIGYVFLEILLSVEGSVVKWIAQPLRANEGDKRVVCSVLA